MNNLFRIDAMYDEEHGPYFVIAATMHEALTKWRMHLKSVLELPDVHERQPRTIETLVDADGPMGAELLR